MLIEENFLTPFKKILLQIKHNIENDTSEPS